MSKLESLAVRNPWLSKSAESLLPSKVFSPATAEGFPRFRRGRVITTSGVPITMQRMGREFSIIDHTKDSFVCNASVPAGQYAIFPQEPFVPRSLDLTLLEQEKLLEEDTIRLQEAMGVKGFKLIVPTAPVVTELFIRHYLSQEGRPIPLMGSQRATSTLTSVGNSGDSHVKVGYFQLNNGLFVYRSGPGDHSPAHGLLRVAVPANHEVS